MDQRRQERAPLDALVRGAFRHNTVQTRAADRAARKRPTQYLIRSILRLNRPRLGARLEVSPTEQEGVQPT